MRGPAAGAAAAALSAAAALLPGAGSINPYRLPYFREPCQSLTKPAADICFPTRCIHLFRHDDGGRLSPTPEAGYPQNYDAFGCNVTSWHEYEGGGGRECLRPTCYCKYGYVGGACQPAIRHHCSSHRCVREPVGSESNPGVDCQDIRERRSQLLRRPGAYWIGNDTQKERVWCDLDTYGRAWELVFRDSSVAAMNITNIFSASETGFGDPHGGVWDRFKASCGARCNASGMVLFKTSFLFGEGPGLVTDAQLPGGFWAESAALWIGRWPDFAGTDDTLCDRGTPAWKGGHTGGTPSGNTDDAGCSLSGDLRLIRRNHSCADMGDQACPGWSEWWDVTSDWLGMRTAADPDLLYTQVGPKPFLWIDEARMDASSERHLVRNGTDPRILKREVFLFTQEGPDSGDAALLPAGEFLAGGARTEAAA